MVFKCFENRRFSKPRKLLFPLVLEIEDFQIPRNPQKSKIFGTPKIPKEFFSE